MDPGVRSACPPQAAQARGARELASASSLAWKTQAIDVPNTEPSRYVTPAAPYPTRS